MQNIVYKAVNQELSILATVHKSGSGFKVRFHDTDTGAVIALRCFTYYDDAEACADTFVFGG